MFMFVNLVTAALEPIISAKLHHQQTLQIMRLLQPSEDLPMRLFQALALATSLVIVPFARADKLVLVAGGGTGHDNVLATQAALVQPFGIDFDQAGNAYLVELGGGRVLRIDLRGTLKIIGGTGMKGDSGDGGPARKASFNGMHNLAVAPDGTVYVADTWNNRIRRIDPRTGTIQAFAGTGKNGYAGDGGPAIEAQFGGIYCLAFNADFSKLYLADLDNRRVRVIDMKTGIVSRVAGNGKKGIPEDGGDARSALLVDPRAVAVDRKDNVYILERSGHALRVVDAAGRIRTVAGTGRPGNTGDGGDARLATLSGPKHLCIDQDDNVVIADTDNHVIRKYTPADGKIARIAGTGRMGDSGNGGEPLEVSLHEPHGVHVDRDGMLYIVDSMNGRVFRLVK
jgi:DNA-binding beta-propeller fold protein YncE